MNTHDSRCENCNFWTQLLDSPLGQCSSPKFVYEYGDPDIDMDGVQVEIDEGWGLFCGPRFGCIHFQPK